MRYPLIVGYLDLQGVTVDQICNELNITRRSFNNKISGRTDFKLNETQHIAKRAKQPIDIVFLQKDVS